MSESLSMTQSFMSVLAMNPIPVFEMLKLPRTRSSEELADLILL